MQAHHLAAWRRRMKFSQRKAAEVLGCAKRSITTYESGKVEIPRYISLACAAVAAGLPPYGDAHGQEAAPSRS